MTTTVAATYEGGVLRPDTPLGVPEGARVQVVVLPSPDIPAPPDPRAVLERIRASAKVPEDAPPVDDGVVVSENVDKILYGGPNGAR